jgi:hypothetical protein
VTECNIKIDKLFFKAKKQMLRLGQCSTCHGMPWVQGALPWIQQEEAAGAQL